MKENSGLGELLRYVTELVDQGSECVYSEMEMNYRPRFTPILRAILSGAETVTEITERTFLTQGAISQSVSMMEKEGILIKQVKEDGRKSRLLLTDKGNALVTELKSHWQTIFLAIAELEKETGHPLITVLEDTARALEIRGFDERIRRARAGKNGSE